MADTDPGGQTDDLADAFDDEFAQEWGAEDEEIEADVPQEEGFPKEVRACLHIASQSQSVHTACWSMHARQRAQVLLPALFQRVSMMSTCTLA